MRRRRRFPCWAWAPLIALPLLALTTCVPGKRIVDGALERQARGALAKAGVDGVSADFNWATGVLTGPPDLEEVALAVVATGIDRGKRYSLRYVAEGAPSSTTTTSVTAATTSTSTAPPAATTVAAAPTTAAPAPTTTVAAAAAPTTVAAAGVSVDAVGDISGSQIVLRGRVATAAEKQSIVEAAGAAFGAARVVDQLTVDGSTPASAAVTQAVTRYVTVLGDIGPRLSRGTASIRDTTITVTGTGFNPQAVTELNAAVAKANGGGVTATGTFDTAAADPKELQAQLTALLGRSGINFAPDSADIDDPSKEILDTAAASIVALPSVRIAIGGHTDNQGSAASNVALSQQRADAVLTYLVGRGVAGAQLTATGYGPDQPIADNATPEGRAANRRIEFAVTGS